MYTAMGAFNILSQRNVFPALNQSGILISISHMRSETLRRLVPDLYPQSVIDGQALNADLLPPCVAIFPLTPHRESKPPGPSPTAIH